ncbi:MAG: SH3 domain-containing protein, partial [Blastocatellia bacterium]
TVVRRKAATSTAGTLMLNAGFSRPPAEAPAPNFQPHVSGVLKGNDRPNRARIVIELPEKPSVAEAPGDATALTNQTPAAVVAPVPNNGEWRGTPVFWAKPQVASVPSPEQVGTASRSRRVIQAVAILVIITCLCLLVAATYRYFADRGLSVPGSGTGSQMLFHEGVIGGASNVNIRSDPNGEALTWLPSGTKVRVLETRAGWLRVKILEWPGAAPTDAPDSGWVDRRFVRFDL